MSLQPGQSIGQYTIEERIGSGGMAVVYKAQQQQLGRTVAIKMMHEGFADDPDLLARFQREARIVATLNHPNIVAIHDYNSENGQPYLVMRYIEGRTLKWHMRKHVLTLAEINTICTAVANALTYAHENDVLHRDIKPGNVMMADDGTPYLTDFGLARVVSQGESTMSAGMIVGTPHYLSPEQASGQYEIGPGADIYALGVMLYEMVVGRVPFSAETPHSIVHDHIYTAPPEPSEVNPEIPYEVEQVLLKALEKDPQDRYATANALMVAFKVATQESGLIELREDRAEIAAQSIVNLRKQKSTARPSNIEAEFDTSAVREVIADAGKLLSSKLSPQVNEWLGSARDAVRKAVSDVDDRPYTPPTSEDLDKQIKRRVERRMRARGAWRTHVVVYFVVNAMIWASYMFSTNLAAVSIQQEIDMEFAARNWEQVAELEIGLAAVQQPWALVLALFWFGGLMAHRVAVGDLSTRVRDKRERHLMDALSAKHGANWQKTITEAQYVQVEKKVEKHFCNLRAFHQHVAVFAFGSVAIVATFRMTREILVQAAQLLEIQDLQQEAESMQALIAQPAFLPFVLVWLVILTIHAIKTYHDKPQDMEEEMERERSWTYRRHNTPYPDKRKNNLEDASPAPVVRLNADGELTNSTVEAWQTEQ